MYRIFICFVFLFSSTVASESYLWSQADKENDLRLWNDNRGNEITARFTRYREGVVYLRTNNRTTVQVRPSEISKKDQQYVIQLLKDQKKEKLADEFARLTQSTRPTGSGRTIGNRGGSPNGGRFNSGNASSSNAMGDEPQASGSGTAVPGGAAGGRGFRPAGNRPPGTTPAGDGPVMYGGDPNRTPSPYTSTPESEAMDLDMNPNGAPQKQKGGIDPFAETKLNRPDLSKGLPSSSSEYLDESGKVERRKDSAHEFSEKDTAFDPFAEMKPVESTSNFDDSKSNKLQNPFESNSTQDGGYTPPVLIDKQDDTKSQENNESGTVAPGGMSNSSMIVIAIGVISLLMLIMIALLVMVLLKSKHPKPRRSFF